MKNLYYGIKIYLRNKYQAFRIWTGLSRIITVNTAKGETFLYVLNNAKDWDIIMLKHQEEFKKPKED